MIVSVSKAQMLEKGHLVCPYNFQENGDAQWPELAVAVVGCLEQKTERKS